MNNYEISGNSDVIIRASNDCVIGENKYEKGDPIAFLKNVKVKLYYSKTVNNSSASQGILTGTYSGYPVSMTIFGVKIKNSIMNLIAKKDTAEKHLYPTIRQMVANLDGEIALPTQVGKKIEDFRIFKKDMTKLKEDSYNIDYENLIISGLTPKESYRIFYYEVKVPISSYYLSRHNIPNLDIEIISNGYIVNDASEQEKGITMITTITGVKIATAPDKE